MSLDNPESKVDHESAKRAPIPIWRRIVFGVLAAFFFVLGAIGLILPGLPTTPFLLLTSYFLVRSVPSLNDRLLRSRIFGAVLTDWQQHRGVRKNVKLKAVVVVVAAVAAALWFSGLPLWAKFSIASFAAIGIVVISRLPSID